jgi:hypothetical protein
MCEGEIRNRLMTAPGMQGNHQIGVTTVPVLGDGHAMAELAQQSGPAHSGAAVAVARARSGWRNECNFHRGSMRIAMSMNAPSRLIFIAQEVRIN